MEIDYQSENFWWVIRWPLSQIRSTIFQDEPNKPSTLKIACLCFSPLLFWYIRATTLRFSCDKWNKYFYTYTRAPYTYVYTILAVAARQRAVWQLEYSRNEYFSTSDCVLSCHCTKFSCRLLLRQAHIHTLEWFTCYLVMKSTINLNPFRFAWDQSSIWGKWMEKNIKTHEINFIKSPKFPKTHMFLFDIFIDIEFVADFLASASDLIGSWYKVYHQPITCLIQKWTDIHAEWLMLWRYNDFKITYDWHQASLCLCQCKFDSSTH